MKSARSPMDDTLVAGKIIIENLPRRPISTVDVHSWLKKYGSISDVSVYKDCILVQFGSDLEAAGAVQCEDGAMFFGSIVTMKHIEPGILSAIVRSGPPIDRYPPGRHYPPARERDADRERLRERERERGRTRDTSPWGRYERNASYDRRRRREDSPRRRSRSPASQRGDRRHVHPLNWLSEVAGADKGTPVPNGVATSSSSSTEVAKPSASTSSRTPPPYTIAIVAVSHDLVPYAETIEKRVSTGLRVPDKMDRSNAIRTHIVVLLSADHLTPCLADLTKDRVPFAFICTTTNWTHGSCTFRILYVPTQQEHRNMPLDDALTLLQKEYDTYMALEKAPSQEVSKTEPSKTTDDPEPGSDDHTFLTPSRNIISLLRMLADSRILSIGELDEISAFVLERKRRLEGRHSDSSADTTSGNSTDLKSRILNMLYPQGGNTSAVSTSVGANMPGMGMYPQQPIPPVAPMVTAQPVMDNSRLGVGMTNPAVQQALDSLMRLPAERYSQPNSMLPPQAQQHLYSHVPQPVPNPDMTNRYAKGAGIISGVRAQTSYGTVKPMTSSQSIGGGGGIGEQNMEMTQQMLNRSKMHGNRKLADGRTPVSGYSTRYSTYGLPPQSETTKMSPQSSTTSQQQLPPPQQTLQQKKDSVSVFKPDVQKEAISGDSGSREDDINSNRARNRKRGKRGGMSTYAGGGNGGGPNKSGDASNMYQSPEQPTKRSNWSGTPDLMSTQAVPIGSLADAIRGGPDSGYGYPSYGPVGRGSFMPQGGNGMQPSAPYYMPHPPGYYPDSDEELEFPIGRGELRSFIQMRRALTMALDQDYPDWHVQTIKALCQNEG